MTVIMFNVFKLKTFNELILFQIICKLFIVLSLSNCGEIQNGG